ncbi:O-antigen ligase family protein [Rhodococcus sp. CH91]|uniref:O-antigen ligase family protein n=1 Tax=Rhodococcus sp. CH91 TaxID=2910256 RepID=UPI001F4AFF4F|nr:O-antigen ligase family protein [Rhodococcus sp. CH91]
MTTEIRVPIATSIRRAPTATRSPIVVGTILGIAAACVGLVLPYLPRTLNPALLFSVLALSLAVLSKPRGALLRTRVATLDIGFIAFVVLSIIIEFANSSFLSIGFSWSSVVTHLTALFAYGAVRLSVQRIEDIFTILRGVVIVAVPVAVIGALQLVAGRTYNSLLVGVTDSAGLERRLELGWPLRATSTIGHWTALSGYLTMTIAAACALMLWRARNSEPYRWISLAITIMFVAQLATVTFAPIAVSVIIVVATAVQMHLKVSHIIVGAITAGTGYILFNAQLTHRLDQQLNAPANQSNSILPESVQYRIGIWERETIPAILDKPVMGWGVNVYNRISTGNAPSQIFWPSPESEWMRTAIAQGIPLAIIQLALLVFAWKLMKHANAKLPGAEYRPLVIAGLGIIFVSTFHSHFSSGSVSLLYWIAAAAAATVSFADPVASESPRKNKG